jgi:hypothetical protein
MIREVAGARPPFKIDNARRPTTCRLTLALAAGDVRVPSSWSRREWTRLTLAGSFVPALDHLNGCLTGWCMGAGPGQPPAVAGHVAAIVKDEFRQ